MQKLLTTQGYKTWGWTHTYHMEPEWQNYNEVEIKWLCLDTTRCDKRSIVLLILQGEKEMHFIESQGEYEGVRENI